jgi:pre-rRNA-processing protein IPI1
MMSDRVFASLFARAAFHCVSIALTGPGGLLSTCIFFFLISKRNNQRMPTKSTRKKKVQAKDFVKQKLKVGQKQATNRTVIDLSSKRVHVPTQTITNEDAETVLSSIKDALIQCKHYSATNRRDALKVLSKIPIDAIHTRLGLILETVCRIMLDSDGPSRKLLHEFFQGVNITAPFMPLVMAFTSSALSHINEGVRISGIGFLELWVEKCPSLIVEYSAKVCSSFVLSLRSFLMFLGCWQAPLQPTVNHSCK